MSIQLVLQQAGVRTQDPGHRHVRAGWLGLDCPGCSPGTGKFRLGFELATGRCVCWACGPMDGVKILTTLCGISIHEAIQLVRSPGRAVPVNRAEKRHKLRLPTTCDLMPAHRSYLEGRGFDPDELVTTWGIRGTGMAGPLRWRIFIPIHDKRGRVVSWTTRAISKKVELRYISAAEDEEETPHKSLLYGAHLAKQTIIVVEGPIDAWSIGPGAVATFGLTFSSEQMALMAGYLRRVICFDSEPEAQRRAIKLCRDLSAMPGTTEQVMLETGKDANSADPGEIAEIRKIFLSR